MQESKTHPRTSFGALLTKILHLNVTLMMSAPQFSSKMLSRLKERGFCGKASLTQGPFFAAFVNKSPTFKYSIIDVGNTIFLQNAETLKRTGLLQESITDPRTGFGEFVAKNLHLNVRLMMLASQFSSKMLKHLKDRCFCTKV